MQELSLKDSNTRNRIASNDFAQCFKVVAFASVYSNACYGNMLTEIALKNDVRVS
uniref:Uncharacterized protein n=1 Tax=Arundo donax TaxID=35708 RepID=A0A0A9D4C6_ARUDO